MIHTILSEPTGVAAAADDAKLVELAREHGTPLYVYDLRRLRARVGDLRSALAPANAKLFFATMANDRLPVLRELAALEVGACVNSIPHLDLARSAGFPVEAIQFTSTGVSLTDMQTLARKGIRANIDSLSQLETWFALGDESAGVRINAASLTAAAHADRIGIDASSLPAAVKLARRCGRRVAGLHVYVGTNFQHPRDMLPTLVAFFELAATVPTLSYVNIGGGIGVNYAHEGPEFDVVAFGEAVASCAAGLRDRLRRNIEVVSEPGRAVTADCATFVTAVTDVKQLRGRRLVGVDGSVSIFPRPLLHPESPHRVRYLSAPASGHANGRPEAILVGRTTYSRDVLGSAFLPRGLEVGALLAFDDAGAYCQSMASRFLGQPEPAELFLDA